MTFLHTNTFADEVCNLASSAQYVGSALIKISVHPQRRNVRIISMTFFVFEMFRQYQSHSGYRT